MKDCAASILKDIPEDTPENGESTYGQKFSDVTICAHAFLEHDIPVFKLG